MRTKPRIKSVFLVWIAVAVSLSLWRYGIAGEPHSWDRLPHAIVLVQVPFPHPCENDGQLSATVPVRDYLDAARLVLLQPERDPEVLVPQFHSAADPVVSYDGRHLLFAGKPSKADSWNIFELDMATREVRRITRDLGNCRQPNYLPRQFMLVAVAPPPQQAPSHPEPSGEAEIEGKFTFRSVDEAWTLISFVRELPDTRSEGSPIPITRLYSCRPDGTQVRRLTANLSRDFDPSVLPDGRIVYSAWRRNSLARGLNGWIDLLAVNTDGTDVMPMCGDGGRLSKRMAAAVPNGLLGKMVFVESDVTPWDGAGDLAAVDLRRPLATYRPLKADDDYVYHSPTYFAEGKVLVSRRPRDGHGSHALGVLRIADGDWTPLFDDPRYHDFHARIVAPQPEPDGRSSVVDDHDPLGTLYCLNVNINDLPKQQNIPAGLARAVRILEGVPASDDGGLGDRDTDATVPTGAVRRLLGEIPLYPDGSFQVKVPGGVPLEIQLIDERGMNLRSCGWIWAQNRFYQGCIGCHEDRELVPDNRMADAFWEPAPTLAPPEGERRTRDFLHDVWPLLVRDCGGCHGPAGPHSPRLWQTPAADSSSELTAANEAFSSLMAPETPDWCGGKGRYVVPGHARLSPVIWHLVDKNTAGPWDGPSASKAPVPMNRPEGRYPPDSLRIWSEWIDFGATWDATRVQALPAETSAKGRDGDPAKTN